MLRSILLVTSFLALFTANGQTYDPFFGSVVANYNYDSILANLNQFEAFGVKEVGTTAISNAQNWIVDKYTSYGYTNITVDSFTYFGNTTANIIIEKQGCQYPNTYVIVDGHYDTKNGPGTNDNGSGTAIILEIARLLKEVDTKYSIRFIHFSGEEDGLKGSQDYVNTVVIPQSMDIKVVFNIDEVGGVDGMINNTIVCERDEGTPLFNNAQSAVITDELVACVGLYSNLNTTISFAYASDYMPFEENGEIITGFYEYNESPYAHTSSDILANMDPAYVHEVGKAACGATMHFAEAYDMTSILAEACDSYISPSGNYTWTSSGVYNDTVTTIAGCDSILEIDLTINTVDASVTLIDSTIFVSNTNADSYQWVDCDNGYAPISGATGTQFTPTYTGNFAVIVTTGSCTDTSACNYVQLSNINTLPEEVIQVYPNPASNELHIFSGNYTEYHWTISDVSGKVISTGEQFSSEQTINISRMRSGFYYLNIRLVNGQHYRTRFVVNK